MARMAGTESTANRMSTSAMPASAAPLRRERQLLAEPPDQRLLGVVVVAVAEQPPAGPDQERGEHEAEPAERADSAAAPTTMNSAAQHEREHDAVAQQPVPLGDRHRERREHEQEDEDVVERERLLDQVAGEERLRVAALPRREQHAEERERDRHPRRAGDAGGAQRHLRARAAINEVDGEQDDEGADEREQWDNGTPPRVVDPRRFLRRPTERPRAPGCAIWARPS